MAEAQASFAGSGAGPAAAAETRHFAAEEGDPLATDQTYYLEPVVLDDDPEDDDFDYAAVTLEDDDVGDDGDEDLDQALRTLKLKRGMRVEDEPVPPEKPEIRERAEVVDDFIRNFLRKIGCAETLETFQREWYALQEEGKLKEEDVGAVPDVYLRNQFLRDEVKTMKEKVEKMEQIAHKARSTWDKFRKERDFHKMCARSQGRRAGCGGAAARPPAPSTGEGERPG